MVFSFRRPIRRTAAVLGAVLLAAPLAGCLGKEPPARDESSGEVIASGQESAFTLKDGDCFNDARDINGQMPDTVTDVPVVPCSEAHDNEVMGHFDLVGDSYPSEEEIDLQVVEHCIAIFDDFVGLSYEDSVLDIFPMTPTEGSWNNMNDREVICAVWDPEGLVTGSLRGSGR